MNERISVTDMTVKYILRVAAGKEEGPRALATRTLRLAIEQAQERMKLAHDKGRSPGITNLFTGVRVPLDWSRRPNGAYDLLLWLASVALAEIAANGRTFSETPIMTDAETLREIMRFVAHDSGISIKAPFPYTQQEMRRAFEEWNAS